mmetsp:Transcript_446/g.610  ORF Transcript_446/g.610 Transcript_446/m.610 type:complete len:81 (+) Transcript_446:142-384(+)|eukprot:CAMPEP_0184540800 /NCGR_PEP_ID=MMETSP0199_2-20130426/945_1 /TAXON_ID=1112570 /ORGANISM="Thraustochytrium sp., Strain LLF1b" /LENGTH=80 /DNA_ID=CAMNT_0026934457 /DNA_START=344 /DNA_END=586 /DNA_ORIENTATION=-
MMQNIVRRSVARTATLSRTAAPRSFSSQASVPSGADVVKKDIFLGLALSFAVSSVWLVWTRGQYAKIAKFNDKLSASHEE